MSDVIFARALRRTLLPAGPPVGTTRHSRLRGTALLPVEKSARRDTMATVVEDDGENPKTIVPGAQCPLTGFPLDYAYKEVKTVASFLEEPPFAGVAKGMDRSSLPKGSELNAVGVRLNNNQLTDLDGLEAFLEAVLDDPSELRWIDLSHNRLTRIDPVLLRYPKLSCVYLHGNRVERLSEVDKLGALEGLTKFTLNGNPVEEARDYRMYVSAALKRLRSLDVIAITPVDRSKVEFWDRARRDRWRREGRFQEDD